MRCVDTRSETRCVQWRGHEGAHNGWDGDREVVWHDPVGPRSAEEWHRAATAISDGLGLPVEVYSQEDGPFLKIDAAALASWWERDGDKIMGRECTRDDGCRVKGHRDQYGHHKSLVDLP